MNPLRPSVVYVTPDKVGGVTTIIANLLQYRQPDAFEHRVVFTDNRLTTETRFHGVLAADAQCTFRYAMPLENMHVVARRLQATIGGGPGVLVCNDFVEMLLLSLIDPSRTVFQILHGDYDYYYDLAAIHEPLVHGFIAYSKTVYDTLCARLPHRRDSIFWLPYGIPMPARTRSAVEGPLRLLFVGRLDEAKGVFDLPLIDRALRDRGVKAVWTAIGDGPARDALAAAWPDASDVRWTHSATPAEVVAACADNDVFVLPSLAEGLSVAMIEAMSAGLVPVVSDLRSMTEVIEQGRTGYLAPVHDVDGFVDAIATLARDRDRLESMSRAAREVAVERFEARARVPAYQALYARWRELYRPRPDHIVVPYGSRLDQPWIPNAAVYAVRRAQRWLRRLPS
jgi:glycosyltransferase involved in cell wall biosynthesis